MTSKTKAMLDKLLRDLRASPDVQAHEAIQAVLMGSVKLNLATHECREVLDILRMEFGWDRQNWAATILLLLKSMPDEFREQGRILIP